jgi:hypothetical protein
MLRAFAVTNLEKTDSSSSSSGDKPQWAWRINVEAIYKSLTALAKFDVNGGTDAAASGLKYEGDTLFVAGNLQLPLLLATSNSSTATASSSTSVLLAVVLH